MNLVQHEQRLNDLEARVTRLEQGHEAVASSVVKSDKSSLDEAIRKAKESVMKN
jgi:hypothetical protein